MSPAQHRGRLIVILESFWAYGWIAAAVVGFFVVPNANLGWRWAFALGALPALYVFVLRRAVPESPRWLASVGRRDEAAATVEAIERESGVTPGGALAGEVPGTAAIGPEDAAAVRPFGERFAELWSAPYRRRTIMLWALWFGIVFSYYGVFTWLPSLLTQRGFNINSAFRNVLIITLAQVPGYFSAAWLVERWGRKGTLVTYLLGSALSAWLLGNADQASVLGPTAGLLSIFGLGWDARTVAVLCSGSLLSFFNLGAWGVVYTYTPEQYPTAARGTGAGSAAAFGRLGAIIGPYLVPWLLGSGGLPQSAIFAMFMVTFLVTAVVVAVLGEETRGKGLEELARGTRDSGGRDLREPVAGPAG